MKNESFIIDKTEYERLSKEEQIALGREIFQKMHFLLVQPDAPKEAKKMLNQLLLDMFDVVGVLED